MTEAASGVREVSLDEHLQAAAVAGLREDLGPGAAGADVTTAACVPPGLRGEMVVVARTSGVVCGLGALDAVYGYLGGDVGVRHELADGDEVGVSDVVARCSGPVAVLLTGERTALNLLSHMSGIATLTRAFVARAPGVAVCDTRKTLPGLRSLQKYAVRAGGGVNHRFALWDGVLVKDNHIAAAGGVAEAIRRVRAATAMPVQVECDTAEQLDEALAAGADSVLLDNHDAAGLRDAVRRIRSCGRAVVSEASGGVTLETIAGIAASGVDRVSVGALTHSAPALDLSMELHIGEG